MVSDDGEQVCVISAITKMPYNNPIFAMIDLQ